MQGRVRVGRAADLQQLRGVQRGRQSGGPRRTQHVPVLPRALGADLMPRAAVARRLACHARRNILSDFDQL